MLLQENYNFKREVLEEDCEGVVLVTGTYVPSGGGQQKFRLVSPLARDLKVGDAVRVVIDRRGRVVYDLPPER